MDAAAWTSKEAFLRAMTEYQERSVTVGVALESYAAAIAGRRSCHYHPFTFIAW